MKIRSSIVATLLVLVVLGFYACPQKPEMSARDGIAAAKGAIQTAQTQYKPSCTTDPTQRPCVTINKAVAAQNVAIDALSQYCSGPGYQEGGVCNPKPDALSHLNAAMTELDQIIKDVQALIKK